MSVGIEDYQRRCFKDYLPSLGIDQSYRFLYGNPILPVIPIDTAQRSVFIIGAYPSARFATIDGVSDVPVDNNLGPFSDEVYFDGSRVRTTASAKELKDLVLQPLGLSRAECWITDLVKIFLFKEGHVERYKKLKADPLPPANRDRFEDYAKKSMCWLEEELLLARPKLVITLGAEVAGILRQKDGAAARNLLLTAESTELVVGKAKVVAAHLAHPGILMRSDMAGSRNPWPKRHREEHLPRLIEAIKTLVKP